MNIVKDHEKFLKELLVIFDLVIISATFILAYYLRDYIAGFFDELAFMYPLSAYTNLLPLALIIWGITLNKTGVYDNIRTISVPEVSLVILKSMLISWFIFGAIAFLFKLHYLSRTFIAAVFFLSAFFLIIIRVFVLYGLRRAIKKGLDLRRILVIGTGKRAQKFIELVEAHPEWGYKIIGLIDDEVELLGQEVFGYKVIGMLDDMRDILNKEVVDDIVIVVPRAWLGKLEEIILYCELLGKRVSIALDLFNIRIAKARLRTLHHFPLMTFETSPDHLWPLFVKRLLDIIISLTSIVLLSPVFLIVFILIKTSSKGPIIFRQTRCGLNGRLFTVLKFRTMVVDAEAKLEDLKKYNEMTGPAFKMKNDPRLIRFGKFMRKFSIDELPQLINVLRGDMSLVGPRPPIPAEVAKYQPWQMRRLSMRPGITCIWQVQGRNRIVKFDEWMKLDLQYIDDWSLWMDCKLFFKTIPIVILGIGAK